MSNKIVFPILTFWLISSNSNIKSVSFSLLVSSNSDKLNILNEAIGMISLFSDNLKDFKYLE